MPDVPVIRQFNGTMRLIEVQLRRVGETYQVEDNLKIAKDKGMLNDEEIQFIKETFSINEQVKAGNVPDDDTLTAIIKRLHKLVAMNLNMGDCA